MTPLQQAYLNKLQANAAANLEFFKKNMPEVYRLVIKESPRATLDISDQGDLAIRYADGSTTPVASYIAEAESRFVEFANIETRPQLLAFHNLRAVQEAPGHGDMQRYHYSNIDAEFQNRVRRHFAEHYPDNAGLLRDPVFGSSTQIPLLIVLGSGVGAHLTRLVLQYDVRHLIVMEADVDAFRLSTFFQDYVQLSRLALEKGTDLAFIVGPDIGHLSRGLMSVLRKSLPPFFVHGAALFYATPEHETVEAMKASITETLWQLFFGLGYFDDEFISIRHTLLNLSKRLPVYTRPRVVEEDAVAFIIGSGPSLDGLLPLLRQYRDQAVLFSCGTALGPLSHAGIFPDFHLEKERPGIVFDVLTRTVPAEFRKEIHFIGLNVVMPEVFDLFGTAGMVLKEVDTPATLLDRSGQVKRIPLDTQPTVTNMALSLALSLGFKRVYLFGVDMGYKDKTRHHSQHTAYLDKMPDVNHLRRLLSRERTAEKTVAGNFGGEANTSNILEMARQHMEQTVRGNPQAKVFNLNDGALIEGAIPLPPDQFPSFLGEANKPKTLEVIRGAFGSVEFDTAPIMQDLVREMDRFIQQVQSILDFERGSRADVVDTIVRLYRYLISESVASSPSFSLFRGTLLLLLSLSYNAVSIIRHEDEAVAKVEYDFANLIDCLDAARAEVVQLLSQSGA